jgi:hypothetical protein
MNPDTPVYLEFLRKTLMSLPGYNEKPCYGTPGFYAGKKMFARMKEDGETLVVQSFEREKWMEEDPETFFITDHYRDYDYMLISLKRVNPEDLVSLLLTAWRNRATDKLIKEFQANLKIL